MKSQHACRMDASTLTRLVRNRALISNTYTKVPGVPSEVVMERAVGRQAFIQDKKLVQVCCSDIVSVPPPSYITNIQFRFDIENNNNIPFYFEIEGYDGIIDWGNGNSTPFKTNYTGNSVHGNIITVSSNTSITVVRFWGEGQTFDINIIEAQGLHELSVIDLPVGILTDTLTDLVSPILPTLETLVLSPITILFTTLNVGVFPALHDLNINANNSYYSVSSNINTITNLSTLLNLEELYISFIAGIITLDVSANILLTSLECSNTGISTLDVTANTLLTSLDCSNTGISTLDVTANTQLDSLICSSTGISTLNVNANILLTSLDCSNTGISTLDVNANILLTSLDCSNTGISTLDVTANTQLRGLICSSTGISTLDVTANTQLDSLICSSTGISTLDVHLNPQLISLDCSNTGISTLDVQLNPQLIKLICNDTMITSLNISTNTRLNKLTCNNTGLNQTNANGIVSALVANGIPNGTLTILQISPIIVNPGTPDWINLETTLNWNIPPP